MDTEHVGFERDDIGDLVQTTDLIGVAAGEDTEPIEKLKSLLINGSTWLEIECMLRKDKSLASKAISGDGSTALHYAVAMHRGATVYKLLFWLALDKEQVLEKRDSDGSTALHIAAIVDNKDAADLLVFKNKNLLKMEDNEGHSPLEKAYEHLNLDTIEYLLEATNKYYPTTLSVPRNYKFAVDLLVKAISVKRYRLALMFLNSFPHAAWESDKVLIALAKTFPSRLDDREKLFYPYMKGILQRLLETAFLTIYIFAFPTITMHEIVTSAYRNIDNVRKNGILVLLLLLVISTVPCALASAFVFIYLLILIVCFPFLMLYYILWKGANILAFPPIKKIENKVMIRGEAKNLLLLVCNKIEKNLKNSPDDYHRCYRRPILEAACQDAYKVVKEILHRSPEAIQSTDKNEYDIIQLAIINRSEKTYNLIRDLYGEQMKRYRTFEDSSKNNVLHLAGRLAPSRVLNKRIGAALQLQHEFQWHEEVKKFVLPTLITQENIFKETPNMIFTREHANLVKEGEQWMKTTAESCSITASLIITIVFAAAITVPGGNNQEKGTPMFKKETAFIIFAISDAISLFSSSTALLVFLSILTARFSEKDFLVSLPRKMFMGLFSLLLSTTAMMVAFSATLFLVFCDKKQWMLGPICGLALIPIASFVGLQFPLMIDLYSSTYFPIFGKGRLVNLRIFLWRIYRCMYQYARLNE